MKLILRKLFNQAFLFSFVIFCFVLTGTLAAQNQYYVSNSGSDSNSGSQASPWKTVQHAASAANLGSSGTCSANSGWYSVPTSGACIHVASGTYNENISTSKSGTASASVVFVSDTQFGAHLVANGCSSWSNNANYLVVAGFDMTGNCSNGVSNNGSFTIWNGNKVHDLPGTGGYGGIVICQSTYTCHDNQVIGNIVDSIGPLGQTNLIHGIYVAGPNNVVENNIVTRASAACITTYHGATHEVISNNTVANCGRYGIQISADGGITTNDYSTINNNIVVNSLGLGLQEYPSVGTHNVYKNNIVYNNAGGNVTMLSGVPSGTITLNSSQFNSLFVNYTGTASGDYHLSGSSTASGSGSTACAGSPGISPCTPSVDFDLAVRATPLSIGAFQIGSVAGIPSAPTGLTAAVQ